MTEQGFKRKLAAILSADVKGYSRLMGNDEEATVRTLTAYRAAITDLVENFRGRIVDTPGDNILADFIRRQFQFPSKNHFEEKALCRTY